MEQIPGVLTDLEHDCKGSVKRFDYGTAYCDPNKGGCGRSQGPDHLWRASS